MDILSFKQVDRIPIMDFGYWPETIREWKKQGLPAELNTYEEVEGFFYGDRGFELNMVNRWGPAAPEGVAWGIYPEFERHVLEENDETVLYGGEGGIVREHKTTGSMAHVVEYPISDLPGFEKKIAPRMNPHDPGRFYDGFREKTAALRAAGEPVGIWLDGFLEYPRELIGIENLCYAYYDDPDFVQGMNSHHCWFNMEFAGEVVRRTPVDYACIVEDMAYKNGSLVSKDIWDRFMKPYYEALVPCLRSLGIKKILVDSDGNTQQVCAWLQEVGVEGHYPLEIAAGNTPHKLRAAYPNLALIGGVDKFELMKDTKAIDAELEQLLPVVEKGGYIPCMDHKVPPTVSLYNYQYYIEKKARLLEQFAR
ncbi:MAG: uroporphyrinogen decarboxylase family protein [Oscillospiraceae bacterium]|nr:uroporphyrinogen decarboxylase family protein [Oscillospiraceae bacterium]